MDFGKTMKALSRQNNWGRIELLLTESGQFYAKAYRTREKARDDYREKATAAGVETIILNDLTDGIEHIYDTPVAIGIGKGPEGALVDLREKLSNA